MVSGGASPVSSVDVWIVDRDAGQRRALAEAVAARAEGRFRARSCASTADVLAAAAGGRGGLVIADLETIGGPTGLPDLLRLAPAVIATSANGSLTAAVAALKAGAVDFVPKPVGARALVERLEAAVAGWPSSGSADASGASPGAVDFAGFIGRSAVMLDTYERIRRVARSHAPVFVTGESGTGKELCAEAVHAASDCAAGPFIAINCSAIPRELMESEIFGHRRGAFTGASEDRAGAAELADGGTLFLDEITEMELSLQAKLLRFLQTGSLKRVGETAGRGVNARIVSASNRDPLAEVEAGRLRADLFYRLHVLPIHLPPLRERPDDVMALATAFLAHYGREEGRAFKRFESSAVRRLLASSWPGNVRELQNVIRRVVVLHDGEAVTEAMLPPLTGAGRPAPEVAAEAIRPFWEEERAIIERAVAGSAGNIARAAAALEISPSTIYRKRQAWAALEAAQSRK